MTITTRNRIILTGLGIVVAHLLTFLAVLYFIFRHEPITAPYTESWVDVLPMFVAVFSELVFAITTVLILFFSFRKTTSPEIFFFIVFVVSLSMDSLKALQVLIAVTNSVPYFGVIVTRAIYFGKFLGTLAVFAAGVFATGIQHQRMEIYLAVGMLLAFVLAASVPVDITQVEPNLVHRLGQAREVITVTILFAVFALLSLVFAGLQRSDSNLFIMAGGIGMAIAGRELLFYRHDSLTIVLAFVLLIGGTTAFSERTHELHLWT